MNSQNCVYILYPKIFLKFKNKSIPIVYCFFHRRDPETLYTILTLDNLCKKYCHVLCFAIPFSSYRKIQKPFCKRDSYNIWVYQDGVRIYDIENPAFDKLDSIFKTIDSKCSSEMHEIWKNLKTFQVLHFENIIYSKVFENSDSIIDKYISTHTVTDLYKKSPFHKTRIDTFRSFRTGRFEESCHLINFKRSDIHNQQKIDNINSESIPKISGCTKINHNLSTNYNERQSISYNPNIAFGQSENSSKTSPVNCNSEFKKYLDQNNKNETIANPANINKQRKITQNILKLEPRKYFALKVITQDKSSLSTNRQKTINQTPQRTFYQTDQQTSHSLLNDKLIPSFTPKELTFTDLNIREYTRDDGQNSSIPEGVKNLSKNNIATNVQKISVPKFSESKIKTSSSNRLYIKEQAKNNMDMKKKENAFENIKNIEDH